MHGIIFNELKKFANTTFGEKTWEQLLSRAGLGGPAYLASKSYPDEEVTAIVSAASDLAGLPPAEILERFGTFIAPDLLAMFRSLVKPDWRTLELLENTEATIHKVVRLNYAEAAPPYLNVERLSEQSVRVIYTSPRRLCSVAKGIVRGVAAHYQETIAIRETSCMLQGAAECLIDVHASPSSAVRSTTPSTSAVLAR